MLVFSPAAADIPVLALTKFYLPFQQERMTAEQGVNGKFLFLFF